MKRQTSVRIDNDFYNSSKEVFDALGLSLGDAVNLFLAAVSIEKKIPFELALPSEDVKKRIENLENDINTETYNTAEDLFKELGI
ncbi:MAG: type II toxin-antitoxin system RelB/DinJ family antitoxin [bacterium]